MDNLRYREAFLHSLLPQRIRTIKEFAVEELLVTSGPYRGRRFSLNVSPWNELLLDALDDPQYNTVAVMAGTQQGKTFLAHVLPILYFLFEKREDVIVLCPNIDLAQSIYDQRIAPVIMQTRYKELIPKKGAGSQGGRFNSITFENGVNLRFMGAGGGDAQRSSYTARIVCMSEIDKMCELRENSDETDSISQVIARTSSYGNKRMVIMECTPTTDAGRINKEVFENGTGSEIEIPCVHCGEYQIPKRDNFTGHKEAETIIEARANAGYICEHCGVIWTEEDRRESLKSPRLKHRRLDTHTFGLRATGFISGLLTMADIAEKEYELKETDNEATARYVYQFVWGEPYEGESNLNTSEVTKESLVERIDKKQTLGKKYNEDDMVVASIDVQNQWCYYTVYGFTQSDIMYLIEVGVETIVPLALQKSIEPTERMVIEALDNIYSTVKVYNPSGIFCDASYKHSVSDQPIVRRWIYSKKDVYALIGRGTNQMDRMMGKVISVPSAISQLVQIRKEKTGDILYFVDVDKFKDLLYKRMLREIGEDGSFSLPIEVAEKDYAWVLKHLTAEKPKIITKGGRDSRVWIKARSRNDIMDTSVYCLAMYTLLKSKGLRTSKPFVLKQLDGKELQTEVKAVSVLDDAPMKPKKRVATYCDF